MTLQGTVQATALQYDDASVEARARSHYEEALSAEVPRSYELVPESVTLAEPELVSTSPDTAEFTMGASATVRARFTQDDESNLTDDLVDRTPRRSSTMCRPSRAGRWSAARLVAGPDAAHGGPDHDRHRQPGAAAPAGSRHAAGDPVGDGG